MGDALCAQCEQARGRILCVDEGLAYCSGCSAELHGKRARRQHRLELVTPPPACDECEEAQATVECGACSGGKEPLLFCSACSRSLHARVARSHHAVKPFPQFLVEAGKAGLGAGESKAGKNVQDRVRSLNCAVKSEPTEGSFGGEHVHQKVVFGNHFVEVEVPRVATAVGKRVVEGEGAVLVEKELPHCRDSSVGPESGKSKISVPSSQEGGKDVRSGISDCGHAGARRNASHHVGADAGVARNTATKRDDDERTVGLHPKRQKLSQTKLKPSEVSGKENEDNNKAGRPIKVDEGDGLSTSTCKKGKREAGEGLCRDEKLKQRCAKPLEDSTKNSSEDEYFSMDDGGSQSDSDSASSGEEEAGVHRIKRGSVSLEAFVVTAEHEEYADHTTSGEEQVEDAGSGVKDRIKKMLKLGLHPDTPEAEAQQALKNAQRLLTKHNLQQAEVMKGELKDSTALVGGMRVVELRGKGRTKQGRFERWIKTLAWVIAENFDVQHFTRGATRTSKFIQVVFYGIRQNADCAGYAFAATFNRITQMSAGYIDPESKNSTSVASQRSTNTRIARMSYRDGVVEGLRQFVKLSQEQRKAGYSTRGGKRQESNEAGSEESEDEDYFSGDEGPSTVGDDGDHNSAFDHAESSEDKKDVKLAKADEQKVQRGMAICALVVHSKKVGEDFLKEKGIKIRFKSLKKNDRRVNVEAYCQGKQDSKQIDINQKGITSATKSKSRK